MSAQTIERAIWAAGYGWDFEFDVHMQESKRLKEYPAIWAMTIYRRFEREVFWAKVWNFFGLWKPPAPADIHKPDRRAA